MIWVIIVCVAVWILTASVNNKQKEEKSKARIDEAEDYFRNQRLQAQRPVLKDLYTEVKGTFHRFPQEILAAQLAGVGDILILEPEPTNEYDPNAVKVLTMEGVHIGYIPAIESKLVASNFDHIAECKIIHKSRHEIPFIDILIKFTTEACEQQVPIDKGIQHNTKNHGQRPSALPSYSHRSKPVILYVQDLYERNRDVITKARAANRGEKILLKKGVCDDCHPERIDVYLEDDTYLGFAEDWNRKEVYSWFDNIVDSFVACRIEEDPMERLCIRVIYPKNIRVSEDNRQLVTVRSYSSIVYPEVIKAHRLRSSDPLAALNILLPIVKIEKGIEARLECISCLYQLKDWPRRIGMIENTIYRINSLTEADLPRYRLRDFKNLIPNLTKQLDFSEKRLESQERKRKK